MTEVKGLAQAGRCSLEMWGLLSKAPKGRSGKENQIIMLYLRKQVTLT